MTVQQRVSVRIGQRVKFKPSLAKVREYRGEGVVVGVSRENGRDEITGEPTEENQIRWDNDGSLTWEMREDLFHIPNKLGDTFVSSGGMGIRPNEVAGVNATKESRDVDERTRLSELVLLTMFGVLPKTRRKTVLSSERELTLEIRNRVAYGYPTKGSIGARKLDKRKLKLAAHAATGEPMLVRKGKLVHATKYLLESNGFCGIPQRKRKKNRRY